MKKVAIYTRVSSDEQAKEGLSIDAQKRKLQDYARYKEWNIVKEYTDAGISGTSIQKRPAFKQLLQDASTGAFEAILLTKFDRAFRSVIDALTTIDHLHKEGIDLVSVSENVDTTSAMGRAFFTIIQAFAELEANKTKERVKDIHNDKFSRGIFVGKPPRGYTWNEKEQKHKPNRDAKIIRQVFARTIKGEGYKTICKDLKINPEAYYRILRNKAYTGMISFQGEEKEGIHDPIISKKAFLFAQTKIGSIE